MKNIPPANAAVSGLTRMEWLIIIALALATGLFLVTVVPSWWRGRFHRGGAWIVDQMNNGRLIHLALRSYAADTGRNGQFPSREGASEATPLLTTSNDAFSLLLPKYLDDKRLFFNRKSAYCPAFDKTREKANQVLPGECDWAYVRGLSTSANPNWPILANAFAPGTTTYVADPAKKGGVYRGVNAVVIWADGSAEVVETKKLGDVYYVKRADKPTANAFERDAEWLAGKDVKVLAPK